MTNGDPMQRGFPAGPPAPLPGHGFGRVGPAAAYRGHSASYEFSPADEETIAGTARWAKGLAVLMFVQAALSMLNNFNFVSAIANVLTGVFCLQAGQSFRAVVDTRGNDVYHLVTAIDRLGVYFLVRIITTVVTLVLLLAIGLFVAAMFGTEALAGR